ncbi:peptidoglycan DD-metalloendopeptidase family protein [Rhodococcus aetherivorans]|uniref:peptidoglycan DD-metalloendopeptidase family protein n=1 Tax=Rhodococcus aetherivorans TaxID=191292 RepID=UPI0028A22251|nr:peptidoglycan DD-metalloendopeptidase family protein [Rhodococcus aetherivorans]
MASSTSRVATAAGVVVLMGSLVMCGSETPDPDNCLPTQGSSRSPNSLRGATGAKVQPMVTGTYTFTSGFGPRWGTSHNGIDLAAPIGTPFYAPIDGIVVAAGDSGASDENGFDNWIIVDSATADGSTLSTVYGHMFPDGVLVTVGDEVRAGDLIGLVGNAGGSTGPHLHFEVWPGGRLDGGSPIDPMPWLADAAELDVPQQRPTSPNVQLVATETPLGAGCTGLTRPGGRSLAPGSVPEEFREWIAQAAQTCEAIDAPLLASQLYAENRFRYGPSSPVSPAGARGPGQFMPATWASIGQDYDGDGVAEVNSIGDAVMAMADYDCQMWELTQQWLREGKVSGDGTELMLSAYNCGPGNTLASGGVCGNAETTGYVRTILAGRADFAGVDQPRPPSVRGSRVVDAALGWLGTEYAWGGGDATGPTRGIADGGVADEHGDHNKVGFDCSGLVVYAVAQATDGRIVLPHQDSAQVSDPRGTPITHAADLQPGDIVQPHPGHVWIWMGDNQVVEAPQSGEKVRITEWTPPKNVRAIRFT